MTVPNAHPHRSGNVAVVHNGIIENFRDIREEMEAAGLYACALAYNAEALAVLTVSDHLKDGSSDLTADERETLFQGALEVAVAALKA